MAASAIRHLFVLLGVMGFYSFSVRAEDVPTHYIVYSLEELKIGDRAGTNGNGLVGSKAEVLVGIDAVIHGSIIAKGNIKLYDRSIVYGDATSQGAVIKYSGATVTGTIQQQTQAPVYTIPTRTVQTGAPNRNYHRHNGYSGPRGKCDTEYSHVQC